MGIYINPSDQSKEEWLLKYGEPYEGTQAPTKHTYADNLLVCYVDNGGFTVAAVCDSERELARFSQSIDKRFKVWYWVPKAKLIEVGALKP